MTRPCVYCGDPVNPLDSQTWQRVVGFQRKGSGESRRSGSDIALRTVSEHFACDACVQKKKRGVNTRQGEMFSG